MIPCSDGVNYECWEIQELSNSISDKDILNVYSNDVERLKQWGGYKSVDIVRLAPDDAQKFELRKKFLCEHTHSEDEVRFFVEGYSLVLYG